MWGPLGLPFPAECMYSTYLSTGSAADRTDQMCRNSRDDTRLELGQHNTTQHSTAPYHSALISKMM